MNFKRHRIYTSEQPMSDRGDGAVLAFALAVIVGVLLIGWSAA